MKLYYSPLACSLAAHIACREAELDVELVRVDFRSKQTADGTDLFAVNPMGQVPTVLLSDGRALIENVAVLSYIADRTPRESREPQADRYELLRWLSFVATELHKKVLWPIYSPSAPDVIKAFARQAAPQALKVVSTHLAAREALAGNTFSVADAYLFWVLTLLPHAGVPLDGYPSLQAYHTRHLARPHVRAALSFEKKQFELVSNAS